MNSFEEHVWSATFAVSFIHFAKLAERNRAADLAVYDADKAVLSMRQRIEAEKRLHDDDDLEEERIET